MSVYTDQSHSRAFSGGPKHSPPETHAKGMYHLKYHRNTERMLSVNRCQSTSISTKKRQKLMAEGQSMHQDDAKESSEMLSIKRNGSCSRGTAQLDPSLQAGKTPSRPMTRALSQKRVLKSQDSAKIVNLDDSTFMGGSCIKMMSEDGSMKRCPPVEVIDIESSAENSGFHPNHNGQMNDCSEFISRAMVKDEISDTRENDHRLGSPEIGLNGEQPMETQPENNQSQFIASDHKNLCPQPQGDNLTSMTRDSSHILTVSTCKQGKFTKDSLGIDQRLGSSNKIGLTFGGQSMDPHSQPEEGQSESAAPQHENDCPSQKQWTQTNFHETGSTFGGQGLNRQHEGGQSQSIASQHGNDCGKVPSTTAMSMDSSRIMQAIFNKYGDITAESTSQSEFYKTHCLEGICKVVQKLHDIHITDMKYDDIKGFYSILRDADSLNFDIQWLHKRLDEVVKVMTSRNELKKLEDELKESKAKEEEILKALELKTIEQAKLEHEIEKLGEQSIIENLKVEELNAQIDDIKSTCLSFDCVMHELI